MAALMDGRAWTATELALEAGVAPSTASAHPERLRDGGLLSLLRQGRHRCFAISDPAVAYALEGVMGLSVAVRPMGLPGSTDPRLRAARVCCDHVAGTLGVRVAQQLEALGYVERVDGSTLLTPRGREWLQAGGVQPLAGRSAPVRDCVDWTERRMHFAGAVAAALLVRWTSSGWLAREPTGRALRIAPGAEARIVALALR